MFLLEASGKDPFLALSSFRRPAMALDSWLFLHLPNASPQPLLPSSYLLSVTLTWCLYKDPWDDIGPTWIIQGDFHVSRPFTSSHQQSPFAMPSTTIMVPAIGTWTSLGRGGIFPPPTPTRQAFCWEERKYATESHYDYRLWKATYFFLGFHLPIYTVRGW